jgi:hypothetical protein
LLTEVKRMAGALKTLGVGKVSLLKPAIRLCLQATARAVSSTKLEDPH